MVKFHGNWCGPNWTDGKKQTAREHLLAGGKFDGPCIDALDCACRTHDRNCSGPGGCTRSADDKLIKSADKIVANPLYAFTNPVMYAKAAAISETFRLIRFSR
jgi:hypothetical protein